MSPEYLYPISDVYLPPADIEDQGHIDAKQIFQQTC